MKSDQRKMLIDISWELHANVEDAYRFHTARGGDGEWLEKQRFLLADMALHLFQTVMDDTPLQAQKLKNNLYSILTISEQFFPDASLADTAQRLLSVSDSNAS